MNMLIQVLLRKGLVKVAQEKDVTPGSRMTSPNL